MSSDRSAKAAEIRRLLAEEGDSVAANTRGFNEGRYESVARLDDYEELKSEARAIKEDAIERLPDLIAQVRESVEENGGTVYLADDAADANRYVAEVCDREDAETLVKSKSMTSEEIEVNDALREAGVEVWETDLGEFVLQVADEAPSHIVAPAIHKSRESIAELFDAHFDTDEPLETAEELTEFAREFLGERIAEADVGMTGANFVAAESGTIALVTSEGNARKSVVAPDTHVAVAGVEKLIPTLSDLNPFVELIGRSGTGQDITSYVSLFTPPVDSPTIDFEDGGTPVSEGDPEDRDFHLVLVDNGRMAMREDDQLRETLYCIRCSACANSCANFQSVGGHAFGGETYSGGIATGWESGVEGLDAAAEFNDLCTGCSRCVNQCPVQIDIPWINTVVRDRINRGEGGNRGAGSNRGEIDTGTEFDWLVEGLTPDAEAGGMSLQKRFFGNFERVAKAGSALAPASNWLADTAPARWAMERVLGIDRRRDLPDFRRETLVDWFETRGGSRIAPSAAEREAVVYPDLYTNHVQVERGKAAVRVLEALGVAVRVPEVASSGRAPLSQGMIRTAARHAEEVESALRSHVEAGRDVVVIEPSDLAVFDREYGKLLDAERHETLAENSYEVLEYVYGLLGAEECGDAEALTTGEGTEVAYHSHCQQRTLDLEPYTTAVLEATGYDVLTSDVECCGMAGSFGYKSEYYELSVDVGEQLRDQFTSPEAANRVVVASGTSCLEQLDSLLGRPTRHPVELLDPAR
ncbi:LUD domain-containing protein [Halorussus caseinilyticus]|uniref:LUD domain-containing protein n=1 Tax=Halorussus caseinilyticus TaxID=3034025 RepID=A0ABD5WE44_9EURY|nr:LUD domain-containing protein [Halorussus sp. DT72]